MAVDFGMLAQVPTIGRSFMAGQEAAQAEQERNMLRQQQAEQMQFQRENMLAQREDRRLQAQERAAKTAQAAQRQQFLTNFGAKLAEGGYKLDRPTLGQMLQAGVQSGEDMLVKLASEGLKALDEEDLYRSEATRFGLPGGAAPEPAAAAAPTNAMAAPTGFTREQVQNMLTSPSARVREQGKALVGTLEKPRPSQLLTPEEEAQKTRIALASRPPAQPREQQPQAPVAVVDPATNRPVLVSREEALAGRMTPATAIEGLTPKERQNREAKYPQATAAVKTFESTTDTLVKDLQRLASHPGLGSITGIAAGRLPGITPDGREAEALFDKIVARGGFQELMNMRNQSPTGGALGNVSNEEGRRLQAAFAALDRRQDAPSVRKAVVDAIEQLQGAKARVRDAYDMTYEYRQGGGASAPAAGALSPAEQAELEQLRKRFGKGG
jgi:hypothetical protein